MIEFEAARLGLDLSGFVLVQVEVLKFSPARALIATSS
jgi:hypothetical protein